MKGFFAATSQASDETGLSSHLLLLLGWTYYQRPAAKPKGSRSSKAAQSDGRILFLTSPSANSGDGIEWSVLPITLTDPGKGKELLKSPKGEIKTETENMNTARMMMGSADSAYDG